MFKAHSCLAFLVFAAVTAAIACSYEPPQPSPGQGGSNATGGGQSSQGGANATSGGHNNQGGQGGDGGEVVIEPRPGGVIAEATVSCGDVECDTTSICCNEQAPSEPLGAFCAVAEQCEVLVVPCDGPEDCPGNTPICCGVWSGDNYQLVECSDECLWPNTPLCHDDKDCVDEATTCKPEQLLGPTYGYCGT